MTEDKPSPRKRRVLLDPSIGLRVNLDAGPGEYVTGRPGNGLRVSDDGKSLRFVRVRDFYTSAPP